MGDETAVDRWASARDDEGQGTREPGACSLGCRAAAWSRRPSTGRTAVVLLTRRRGVEDAAA
jgi:hypothetical protein